MVEHITDKQFHRIHLFIGEGQVEDALTALEQIQPADEKERQEVAYLRAWCYTEQGRWDEAAHMLPEAGASEEAVNDIQALGQTERRRRAYYQLLMGNIAVNRGHHEEGMRHYRKCIKFLDERRMNIPNVRIQALMGMGTLSVITGFYDAALIHFEEALRLCNDEHPNLPDIYYGLADLYRHKGDFPRALECGKKAWQIYTDLDKPIMVGRILNLLGRICFQMRDFEQAAAYYTEALAISMVHDSPLMPLINLVALADLRREEGQLKEAWRYCNLARDLTPRLPSHAGQYRGMMHIVCGKVKESEAEQAEGQRAVELRASAISYFEKAIQELEATDSRGVVLAEAYQRLAQALEASGKQELAITYWKSAFSASSSTQNSSPF